VDPSTLLIVAVVVIVIAGGAVLFVRYRRSQSDTLADVPPPDIGELVDYTSMPEEPEPQSWQERLAGLSMANKVLLLLVPLILVGAVVALVLMLSAPDGGTAAEAPTPTPEPGITLEQATLVNPTTINVVGTATLPPGTTIRVSMLEDGEDFSDWLVAEEAAFNVTSSTISQRIGKATNGPNATPDASHTVIVTAEVNGEEISASTELQVPSTYQSAFYESPPTPTPARPTPRPTPTDAPEPTPEEEQEPTATPEPQPAQGAVAAAVGNGGNVRAEPNAGAAVVGQVAINDSVEVLEKTADDIWYRIRFGQDDVTGWAHYAVLLLEQDVINQIPVQGAATTPDPTAPPVDDGSDAPADPASTGLMVDVFNGGNVRSEPSLNSRAIVDQVNAGERVELLQKTSDSVWYQITTERDTTGWVHNSLLTIPDEIAAQVPVQG
jgi:SH3-like domain-containing protein/flagellar basal body-associated protein FliL